MHTPIKDLLYSTENYTLYFVMTYKGKESGKKQVYLSIYLSIYLYLNHFTLETHTTLYINSTSIKK